MRSLTAGQITVLSGTRYWVSARVSVKSSLGVYQDLSALYGTDWLDEIILTDELDRVVQQAEVRVWRETSAQSLAPLVETDIDVGREIKIEIATTAEGVSPTGPDWAEIFHGYIDAIAWEQTPMILFARDDASLIVDRWVEEERVYGDAPMLTVMQAILDDWADGMTIVADPSPPSFQINKYNQQRQSVHDALMAIANLIGYGLRMKWNTGAGAWRLTLYEPDRTASTPVWTFDATDYVDVVDLNLDRSDVRNVVNVRYTDATTGERDLYTVTAPTSISRFGRRYMEFDLASTSPIDTLAEAQSLANAAVSDLSEPVADQEIEILPTFWPLEMGDYVAFTPNGVHYDTDQAFGVTGIRHEIGRERHRTFVRTRGKPAAYISGWFVPGSRKREPDQVELDLSILNFRETARDSTSVTFGGELGAEIAEVWIYKATRAQPVTDVAWPDLEPNAVPSDIFERGVTADFTYTVQIPADGFVTYVTFEPRKADLSLGIVERVIILPNTSESDIIVSLTVDVVDADGSVTVSVAVGDRTRSIRYAYNVGDADAASPVLFPSVADVEASSNIVPVTGTAQFRIAAGALTYGQVIRLSALPYLNDNGTGPGGVTDHGQLVGAEDKRVQLPTDGLIGVISSALMAEASRRFGTTISFSATAWDTVTWTTGTLLLSDGSSYSMLGGSLTMTNDSLWYIYFDSAVSTTQLQSDDTIQNAIGDNRIIVAVARRTSLGSGSGQVAFVVPVIGRLLLNNDNLTVNSVTTNSVAANAITAAKISVVDLAAINVDAGTITAGLLQNAAGQRFVDLEATGTNPFIKGGDFVIDGNSKLSFGAAQASGKVEAWANGYFEVLDSDGSTTLAALLYKNVGGNYGMLQLGRGSSVGWDVYVNGSGGDLWIDRTIGGSGGIVLAENTRAGGSLEIDGDLNHDGSNVGFYGTAPGTKPTVTGSTGGNAALQSLLSALAGLGLITDSTT